MRYINLDQFVDDILKLYMIIDGRAMTVQKIYQQASGKLPSTVETVLGKDATKTRVMNLI